ncbi:hypothetical protein CYY_003297 [Polysphondylium violaceum]|uniref:EGF-like domain-containing protein n=1 Tax=Polysphondylium violaceum TaxID=133409 RepID=A0A8J4V1F2_9MYCE|nr:hypothetical protein CYY_003297 [Polysphondylium violaceum]
MFFKILFYLIGVYCVNALQDFNVASADFYVENPWIKTQFTQQPCFFAPLVVINVQTQLPFPPQTICNVTSNPLINCTYNFHFDSTNTTLFVQLYLWVPPKTFNQEISFPLFLSEAEGIKRGTILQTNKPLLFSCDVLDDPIVVVKTLNNGSLQKSTEYSYSYFGHIQVETAKPNLVSASFQNFTIYPVDTDNTFTIKLKSDFIFDNQPTLNVSMLNQVLIFQNPFALDKIEQNVDVKGSYFSTLGFPYYSKILLDYYFEDGLDSPYSLDSFYFTHGNSTHFQRYQWGFPSPPSYKETVYNGTKQVFTFIPLVESFFIEEPQNRYLSTPLENQEYISIIDANFNTNISFSFEYNGKTISSSYPFGLINVLSNGTMVNRFSTYFNSLYDFELSLKSPNSRVLNFPAAKKANSVPSMKEFNYTITGNNSINFRFRLIDDFGVYNYYFRHQSIGGTYNSFETLVSGNEKDGVYQLELSNVNKYFTYSLTVYNINGRSTYYSYNYLYLNYGIGLGTSLTFIPLKYIKDVYVEDQVVDVSNGSFNTSLYLLVDKSFPILQDSLFTISLSGKLFPSFLNNQGYYQFDIVIPAKIRKGYLSYSIYFNDFQEGNEDIYSIFGEKSQIMVTSGQFDFIGPVVESHGPSIPVFTFTSTSDSVDLSWSIRFSDMSGFKSATVNIISDFDRLGYTFNLTSSDLISGDAYDGVYKMQFPTIRYCKNMKYYISSLTTIDLLGNSWTYGKLSNRDLHPLYKYDKVIENPEPTFELICNYLVPNDIVPSISKLVLNSPTQLDTLSNNRGVKAEFTVINPDIIGISLRHLPICFFQTFQFADIVNATSVIKTLTNPNNITYECIANLPYGYGLRSNVAVSIYGISNNYYNLIGYSAIDLQKQFSNSIINTTINQPTITSYTTFESIGGKLTIYGNEFGNNGDNSVSIIFSNQTTLTPLSLSNDDHQLITDHIGSTNISFTVQLVNKFNRVSNLYSIYPKILCSSDCGVSLGYGYCNNRGTCTCLGDRAGEDCMSVNSKPIITPNPISPSVNISANDFSESPSFTSFLSVVSLRELEISETIVNEFIFDNTKWENIKDNSSTTQYSFKYSLANTTIVSNVQVFTEATNITFGNQQLQMFPSSIKFTFDISAYPFAKSTNSLQLVMLATFKSKDTDVCSFTEFTSDSDYDQYLKIQIQDRSLFGRFVKYGIIDGRERVVTNKLLTDISIYKSDESQTFIGLNIPYYSKQALLDPDFSVLINTDKAGDKENSICYEKSKGLTSAQIAGIVVGGAVFLFIVAALVIFFLSRNSKNFTAVKLRKIVARN